MTPNTNGQTAAAAATADGFCRRFERRPEFRLFGNLVPEVVDASTVRTRTVDDLKVFRIADVFAASDEIFIGFGKPNTYLVVPDGKAGYQKFAGKSLKRAPSVVQDTRGFVQSGILIRLKNLPAQAAQRIREGMQAYDGQKFWTCVNACMHVMEHAGFTSGSKPLSKRVWPYSLLASLLRDGLQFEGKDVEFEVIRTTDEPLQRYAWQIISAELSTFTRHADRALQGKAKKSRFFAGTYKIVHAPGRLLDSMRKRKLRMVGPVAPALPEQQYCADIRVRVSRSSGLGTLLRQLWGAHTLFESQQDRVKLADFLPSLLKPFPQPNPSMATRAKKMVLFSRPVIWLIRRVLAKGYFAIGAKSERDIYDMLRTDSEKSPNKYNLVITRSRIIISRINVGVKLIDWILSKHVLISGYDPQVAFAGELWKDANGVIHINRNSGTYQPSEEMLDEALAFMRAVFPHLTFVKD